MCSWKHYQDQEKEHFHWPQKFPVQGAEKASWKRCCLSRDLSELRESKQATGMWRSVPGVTEEKQGGHGGWSRPGKEEGREVPGGEAVAFALFCAVPQHFQWDLS